MTVLEMRRYMACGKFLRCADRELQHMAWAEIELSAMGLDA